MNLAHTQYSMNKYECIGCNFYCIKLSDWNRHVTTKKHKIKVENKLEYVCKNCNKCYSHRSSLWYHAKRCNVVCKPSHENTVIQISNEDVVFVVDSKINSQYIQEPIEPEKTYNEPNPELILEIMKQNHILIEQNQEFKNLLLEQNAKFMEMAKQNVVYNHTNNNNNNHFNLNIFLNEKCKDAISIMDFVNSLDVNTCDVEYTGKYGYVEGITKIFIEGLKQLDVYKRPIHCTDLKRETLYIKEETKWEKDTNEKSRLKRAINTVVRKNVQQVKKWQDENPKCNILDSKEYMLHMNIMRQSLGGGNQEKTDRNNDKIIKNIAREVHLDKSLF
jgi:hypothetical protein